MARRRKRKQAPIVESHLSGIKRALLDGDKRPAFLDFLKQSAPTARGIYALYDARGRLYYAGRASDLPARLNQHLKDRHGESWDRMTLYIVSSSANVGDLESLLVTMAKPPANKQKPKAGRDLRKSLRKHLRVDATVQIDQAIYPEKLQTNDRLFQRITTNRLQAVSQKRLAAVLDISQPRVSQLLSRNEMRAYIRDSGNRDAVLALLQKAGH